MLANVLNLARAADVSTTAARARIGIVALEMAGDGNAAQAEALHAAITALAIQDAYAAHDVLARCAAAHRLTAIQSDALRDLVRASSLGTGTVPVGYTNSSWPQSHAQPPRWRANWLR
jgi:hypothetical protein